MKTPYDDQHEAVLQILKRDFPELLKDDERINSGKFGECSELYVLTASNFRELLNETIDDKTIDPGLPMFGGLLVLAARRARVTLEEVTKKGKAGSAVRPSEPEAV